MYKVYAVISGKNKYHASFVMKNSNKNQEVAMREHYKRVLNKKSISLLEYYSTESEKLAKDVATNLHKAMTSDVLLIDGSDPEIMMIADIVEECLEIVTGKKAESIDLRN